MSDRIIPKLPRRIRRRLERERRATRDAGYRTRIQIVLLYDRGLGTGRIADMLGTVPSRAINVLHRFRELGEDGLVDGRRDNGVAKVDEDLLQALAEILKRTPQDFEWNRTTWTRELLTKQLGAKTGIWVSQTTMSRMLRQIGATRKVPKLKVFSSWTEREKEARRQEIARVLDSLGRNEVAYYQDEVDIDLNPRVGKDWMLPGHRRTVMTPGKNVKRHVAGALAADGSGIVWVAGERKHSWLFVELLEELRCRHPRARHIHLILDNCSIHKSQAVKSYLRNMGDLFILHFLPPYSPDDNKIERFWLDLHSNVTRNHKCRTIDQLMANVEDILMTQDLRRFEEMSQRKLRRTG